MGLLEEAGHLRPSRASRAREVDVVSQYPDLLDAIAGLLQAFPLTEQRGAEATVLTCPVCGRTKVTFDDDTDPTGYLNHQHDCPWLRADRTRLYHEAPFSQQRALEGAVRGMLFSYLPSGWKVPADEKREWSERMALALLDAIDVRVRHRDVKPEKKPGA